MLFRQWAVVTGILEEEPDYAILQVDLDGGSSGRAWSFPKLTGTALPGDKVLLNTAAVRLGLGTGGLHFVMHVEGRLPDESAGPGHIMKMRYTPWQVRVLAGEEEDHGGAAAYRAAEQSGLENTPVAVCELHSQLLPVIWMYRRMVDRPARIAYVMTDGAALPAWLSRQARELKKRSWLTGVITTGHAFGGDLEAVNVYSGLLLAKSVLGAEFIVVAMGPGIAGTGTRYGFSGMEAAYVLQAVHALGGVPIVCLRMSSAEQRLRHQGISHHSLTVLGLDGLPPCWLAVPVMEEPEGQLVDRQLVRGRLAEYHAVVHVECNSYWQQFASQETEARTMGRKPADDPLFYRSALACGALAARFQPNRQT